MRYFTGTKECWFCGKKLTQEEIKEYYPYYSDFKSEEEQCPYCGYHNVFIEEENLTVSKP